MLVKVEELLWNGGSGGLIIGVVVRLKIRMLQGLLNGDALDGVEGKKLLKQVQRKIGSLGEEGPERDLLLEGQRANIFPGTPGLDAVVVLHGGSTQDIQDECELVMI